MSERPSAEKDAGAPEWTATDRYIWLVYNTPELHGSYCPCGHCGPKPEWIHEIGRRPILPEVGDDS
jgi:hypothetical protein